MLKKQKTIAKKIFFQGIGLYTGKKINIILNPAPIFTGFLFVRIDLNKKPCIKVNFSSFKEINKGIILEKNGLTIYAIEHIMAALNGMDLDNVIIELDNIEVPMLDGSSKLFVDAIEKVGIIEQNAEKKIFTIKEFFSIKNRKTGGEIIAIPSNIFEIIIFMDFESNQIDSQNAFFRKFDQFKLIAKSKSFCILNKDHRKKNLIGLNFNEIVKHFLLDIIGFFSLVDIKIKGKIIIHNPDNIMMIKFLKKLMKKIYTLNKLNIVKIDLNKKTIFDIKNIANILPHKPPFLFVDKIIDLSDNHIIGIKNVTINEYFFIGHFPNEPIMPGVLQIESIAQVGGILILSKIQNPELYSTYLIKIDKVKFKKKVIPGDIMILKVYLLESMKRGIIFMKGIGYVKKNLVVEAEMVAKIVQKINL
ncbi:3-hydroxyacyl-ACP dehydratase FabZ [Blattabacterium cuenoti]|uniref:3-hydroxyacyl-ACP dehydratase FabZ n=1 Tax=Blattabacterium cuenoti TaxID=1653831 RepID=UPI00163CDF70|nr:3-hydroxyacyl-ACP dehydratase FabZ [Blattabacterium cuenoti]